MRRYGILQALFLSFGSPALYRDVAAHWRGAAYVLLLLLALLITLRITLTINNSLDEFNRAFAPGYIRQLPTITVDNGKASTAQQIPYLITEPNSGQPVALIDTTRDKVDAETVPAIIFVSRTQVTYRKNANETRIYELEQIEDMVITQAYAREMMQFLADWLGWILAPFIFVGVYVIRLLLALVFGLVGLIFTAVMQLKLPYDALVSLAIVAAAPVIVVEFVLNLLLDSFSIYWPLGLLINLALLGFAVHANRPVVTD